MCVPFRLPSGTSLFESGPRHLVSPAQVPVTVSGQLSSKRLTLRSGWLLTRADQEPVQLQKWESGGKGRLTVTTRIWIYYDSCLPLSVAPLMRPCL